MTGLTPHDSAQLNEAGMDSSRRSLARLSIVYRIAAAFLGGYTFTWGFIAFGVAALTALGMDFHEAEHGTMLLAFIVFLCFFLWAFAGRSLAFIWMVLAGGGAAMTSVAWFLQRLALAT